MDDPARPDVLFLAHRVPFPPDKGDRIRTFQLLRYLSERATLHLACLADEPVSEETLATLRRYARRVAVVPVGGWSRWARALGSLACGHTVTEGAFRSPALRATLRAWAAATPFHASLATASSMVPYLRLPELRHIPAVVDLMDVDSQKWHDYANASRIPRAWLYRLEGRRLRRLEQGLPAWAQAVTLVSEAEANLYRGFSPAGQVQAVGNGVDLEYFRPQGPALEPRCVFVGALDYRPNVDGASWFCREVWPEVLRRRPDATLSLVGRRPAPAVTRLAGLPGVEVVGQVPDVRPYLGRSAVAVVPLQVARGIQNKILEALATARAVVASAASVEGLGVEPGVHLLSAVTPADWVEAILRLLEAPALRERLGAAGRSYVETHHRWDRCLAPFSALLGLPDASAPRVTADARAALVGGESKVAFPRHAAPPAPVVLGAATYARFALGFLLFAIYGSLVPFHYQPLPLEEALSRFQAVCQIPVRVESRSDWIANILLFIPLGFLLTAALAVDRRRAAGLLAALVVIPGCGLLSAALEFTQLYFPPRVTSLNDIVAESVGAAVGALFWLAAGQALTERCRRVWGQAGPRGAAVWLFPAYLATLLLVSVLPLDLTLSPAELYHKYRDGHIRLIPWVGRSGGLLELVRRDLDNFACFLPFGLLLAGLPAHSWRQARGWPRVLALGLGLAVGIELLQLLVLSRSCDATDVVTGGLATLAGWGMGLACIPSLRAPSARALALAGWLVVLIFVNWQPFDFAFDPALRARRLREFSLIPFADYFQSNYLGAFDQFVHKVLYFVPVGALLLPPRARPARTAADARLVLAGACLLAGVLEAGQAFLPTHYPSITDVLVGCLGAWFGLVMARQVQYAHLSGFPPRDGPVPASGFPRQTAS